MLRPGEKATNPDEHSVNLLASVLPVTQVETTNGTYQSVVHMLVEFKL